MENFKNELELIKDEKLRAFTEFYLSNRVPSYFWEIGASASGKYHPPFSQGNGGLVRHTKAVVYFCDELIQAVASHMGQWSTERDDRPFTPVDRLVHMADYIASRPMISNLEIFG